MPLYQKVVELSTNTNHPTMAITRGVIYCPDQLNVPGIPETSASETMLGKLITENNTLQIIATYRPPKTNKLRFLEEIKILLKQVPTSDDIVVIGDTNLDMLGDKVNATISKYKNMMCEHGLECAIPTSEITREAVVDGLLETSCIDHVWVRSRYTQRAHAHILMCKLSDHYMVGVRLAAIDCGRAGVPEQIDPNCTTSTRGTAGSEAKVSDGVPTGSVYGPVGYIMHVNSVANVVHNSQLYMYADDMCLLSAGKDIASMMDNIQDDFENITKWAHDNGIILNLNKTKCMHIHSPYNNNNNK
ncbi:unnamed protein product [Plutella xylostella]|uniref:(diamondback moth) hypothetical protein n=1 Tax=Plutella xylostella TaxID=51655 RepID=A0A8S4FGN7_PLUXY|nr:unnamed protein product [Plutella xylostella]